MEQPERSASEAAEPRMGPLSCAWSLWSSKTRGIVAVPSWIGLKRAKSLLLFQIMFLSKLSWKQAQKHRIHVSRRGESCHVPFSPLALFPKHDWRGRCSICFRASPSPSLSFLLSFFLDFLLSWSCQRERILWPMGCLKYWSFSQAWQWSHDDTCCSVAFRFLHVLKKSFSLLSVFDPYGEVRSRTVRDSAKT